MRNSWYLKLSLGFLLASVLLSPSSAARAATGTQAYVGFHKQTTAADFEESTTSGVVVGTDDGHANVHLAGSGLLTGANKKLYKVKSYQYGTLESPVFDAAHLFDTVIPSWNATTPEGTWVQLEMRAWRAADAHWTKYYNMGYWASGTETVERSSVNSQGDADGFVATDTPGRFQSRCRWEVDLLHRSFQVPLEAHLPARQPLQGLFRHPKWSGDGTNTDFETTLPTPSFCTGLLRTRSTSTG